MDIKIYTDGSCKPTNPGPAGFGIVIIVDGEVVAAISRFIGVATNNVAEIEAIHHSLALLQERGLAWNEATIYTDSQYAMGLFNRNWQARKNQELANMIKRKLENFPNLKFEWVKGHNGDRFNEMADDLSRAAIDIVMKEE